MLAGLFHPAVYLTNERYEKQELCFILTHELTHYQRKDLWYKLLMQVVVSIYWFNPFLYKMRRDAERIVENLCDARVVGGLSSSGAAELQPPTFKDSRKAEPGSLSGGGTQ